jgi:hypothetical protein
MLHGRQSCFRAADSLAPVRELPSALAAHPEHCYGLHAEAIRALYSRSDRTFTMVTHARSRRKPATSCGMHPSLMHGIRNVQLVGSPRDRCQLEVGWARLARAMRLASTISRDFSRWNARGRSGLQSRKDAWTSQTHDSP